MTRAMQQLQYATIISCSLALVFAAACRPGLAEIGSEAGTADETGTETSSSEETTGEGETGIASLGDFRGATDANEDTVGTAQECRK